MLHSNNEKSDVELVAGAEICSGRRIRRQPEGYDK